MRLRKNKGRQGTILPFLAISIVALCGFLALAIDVGMIIVAKTQAQNAADAGAFAGARTLNGASGANLASATSNAKSVVTLNKTLSQVIPAANITVTHGAYHYDSGTQTFSPQFPPQAPDNYNLTQVSLTQSNATAFARVFNLSAFNVAATAIAAHRPRDTTILLDFSGSMNNETDLWNCESYLGSLINTSNSTDPIYPQWGPYNPTFSPNAQMLCTSSDPQVGLCNITQTVLGVPPLVNDYYQNARGTAGAGAFLPVTKFTTWQNTTTSVTVTQPGGDIPLNTVNNTSATPALTCKDILGSPGQGFRGYAFYQSVTNPPAGGNPNYGNNGNYNGFYGYTRGPNYWGNTFFIWPPCPTTSTATTTPDGVKIVYGAPNDWRKRFFYLSDGVTPLNDNTKLFNGSGSLNTPTGNYVINYKAILAWISANCIQQTAGDGKPFPPILRSGNILYYNTVPADVPVSAYTWTNPNGQIADPNQRFWKEYIDFVLGVWRDPLGNNIQVPGQPACSYGPDFQAGSTGVSITGPDSIANYAQIFVNNTSSKTWTLTKVPFINPTDNPLRPRHRFWFGPMTMIQFMLDTGLTSGTTHDISMIAAKLGIQGALQDVSNNHPNDLVSMILFARPHYNGEPAEVGVFTLPQFSLSNDYQGMINSLWYPPNSGSTDVTPWDPNGLQTPRAHGDYCANTATSYGLMLAYNQFSSNAAIRASSLGGLGRKGSQRLVILETDGMANVSTNASFNKSVSGSTNNSYYNLGGNNASVGSANAGTEATDVATKIAALTTDNTKGPGFATPTKPVIIHCVAFGAIFEPTASGSQASQAMSLLQSISAIGGTGFPASVTDTGSPYYYKLCIGTLAQRQSKLQTAFTTIMDDGVAIVLVK